MYALRSLVSESSSKWASTIAAALVMTGGVSVGAAPAAAESDESEVNSSAPVALNPKEWRTFRVRETSQLTPSTARITLELPSPGHQMGLNVASCLMARAKVDGKNVARPYTPINSNSELGVLDLAVKGYPTGKLSKHLVSLKAGDTIELKGPFQKFQYKANEKKEIVMLAGGSGITPMLQVVKEILRNPADNTKVTLVFANTTEEEIILRNEIDALRHLYPQQFNVIYCLDKAPQLEDGEDEKEQWKGGHVGYITEELLTKVLPAPSDDVMIMVCGPPPMMFHISGNKAKDKSQGEVEGLLKKMNYTSSMVYKF